MRPALLISTLLIIPFFTAGARVLTIGDGGYAGLQAAAADARPGDTLLFAAGTHAGGAWVSGLQGTADAWITLMGDSARGTLIRGGSNAFQLSDPAFLRIAHLRFDGQTGNGVNIDDGGSFDTPAHDLVIEHCAWLGIDATGNNDMLKLSGVDRFTVRHCTFTDGSPGGSMIDMVGCHEGIFEGIRFENGGSNCIQAKGGTRHILVTRCAFRGGGQRAINIGGSTGLPYFRPQDADYEASDILVAGNIFTGAVAPIAYVGAVRCEVVNNTFYLPEKWAVRILQESTDARFVQCGENSFRNNIIVLDDRADAPTFNVGSNTRPETFLFSHNLWFHVGNPGWSGPNAPTPDAHMVLGADPLLASPSLTGGDFSLLTGSPAIAAGSDPPSLPDFLGNPFNAPPSIGAIEGNPVVSAAGNPPADASFDIRVHPHPLRGSGVLEILSPGRRAVTTELYDAAGRRVWVHRQERLRFGEVLRIGLESRGYAPGWYFLRVSDDTRRAIRPILILR